MPSNKYSAKKKELKTKAKIIAKREQERLDDVARSDMAIGLMSLFKAGVRAGRRQETTLEQKFAGTLVRIRGVELDCFDQDIFLGILAISLKQHDFDAVRVPGSTLPSLKSTGEANDAETICIKTTIAELMAITGKGHGGAQEEAAYISIERLSMIILTVIKDKDRGSQHLISCTSARGESLQIQLSWRLTKALFATGLKGGGSYAAISMIERRSLPAGVPRLVHAYLCSWRPGIGTGRIKKRNLVLHIYGPRSKNRSTQWRRNIAVSEALELIGMLPDWTHISLPSV